MQELKKTVKWQYDKISRRDFINGAATAAAFIIVPRHVLGGNGHTPASDKLNVALIGIGGQGKYHLETFLNQPDVNVVAVCDVSEVTDYRSWYYGGFSGRKPARLKVEKYYNERKPKGTYRGCPAHVNIP